MTPLDAAEIVANLMPAVRHVEQRCTDAVGQIIATHGARSPVTVSEGEWTDTSDAFAAREAFYAAMMPDEQDAIRIMHAAFERLKALGWREAIYCPKDGSAFDAIEPGSTGIHSTHYSGSWPDGMWLIDGEWPSRPCLYRPTAAEVAERAALRARAALLYDRGEG